MIVVGRRQINYCSDCPAMHREVTIETRDETLGMYGYRCICLFTHEHIPNSMVIDSKCPLRSLVQSTEKATNMEMKENEL